jgi:preprotein translocase subunit SecE
MNIIAKPVNFLKEVKLELSKVSWSNREELLGATFVVIGITAIMTVFIYVVDIGLTKLLRMLFS